MPRLLTISVVCFRGQAVRAYAKQARTTFAGLSLQDVIEDYNESAGLSTLQRIACVVGFVMEGSDRVFNYARKKLDEENIGIDRVKVTSRFAIPSTLTCTSR